MVEETGSNLMSIDPVSELQASMAAGGYQNVQPNLQQNIQPNMNYNNYQQVWKFARLLLRELTMQCLVKVYLVLC